MNIAGVQEFQYLNVTWSILSRMHKITIYSSNVNNLQKIFETFSAFLSRLVGVVDVYTKPRTCIWQTRSYVLLQRFSIVAVSVTEKDVVLHICIITYVIVVSYLSYFIFIFFGVVTTSVHTNMFFCNQTSLYEEMVSSSGA